MSDIDKKLRDMATRHAMFVRQLQDLHDEMRTWPSHNVRDAADALLEILKGDETLRDYP